MPLIEVHKLNLQWERRTATDAQYHGFSKQHHSSTIYGPNDGERECEIGCHSRRETDALVCEMCMKYLECVGSCEHRGTTILMCSAPLCMNEFDCIVFCFFFGF